MAQSHGVDEMVVLLGTPNAESSRLYALTLKSGDPSWVGALAGVELGLPAWHITEEEVKRHIPTETYEEHVALMEMVMDVGEICEALRGVRAESSAG